MTMTLEQVRHRLDEWGCSSLGQVQLPTAYLRQWRDAIDAHLTQPAQAVDVGDDDVEAAGVAYFEQQWDVLPPRSKAIYRNALRRALTSFASRRALSTAQAEVLACQRCGARSKAEAETKCLPEGDSCPGCESPLSGLWEAQADVRVPDVDCIGLALDLEQQSQRCTSQTMQRAIDAAIEAAVRDAARYRHMRDELTWSMQTGPEDVRMSVYLPRVFFQEMDDAGDGLDGVIDAALAAQHNSAREDGKP